MFAPERPRPSFIEIASVSFNEAGACLPRKAPRLAARLEAVQASMRPGHVCPGKRTARSSEEAEAGLQ